MLDKLIIVANTTQQTDAMPQLDGYIIFIVTLFSVLILELLLYLLFNRKTRIDQAIVRTGLGGVKVVVDNGTFIIPLFHSYKVIYLCQQTVMLSFKGETKLLWANHDDFEGSIFITLQIPPENSTMIVNAARNFVNTETPDDILMVIEPAFRAAIRENFRNYRSETFDFEPNIVEVRLTRSLEIVAFAFGLKVRAIYIHKGDSPGASTKLHIEKYLMKSNSEIIERAPKDELE